MIEYNKIWVGKNPKSFVNIFITNYLKIFLPATLWQFDSDDVKELFGSGDKNEET